MGPSLARFTALALGCLVALGEPAGADRKKIHPMEAFTIVYTDNSADQTLPFELRCDQAGVVDMLVRTNRGLLATAPVGCFRTTVAASAATALREFISNMPKPVPVSGAIPGEIVRSVSLKGNDGPSAVWYATESTATPKGFADLEVRLQSLRDEALKHPLAALRLLPFQMKSVSSEKSMLSAFLVVQNCGSSPVWIPDPRQGDPNETVIEINAVRSDLPPEKLRLQDQIFLHIVRRDIGAVHAKAADGSGCRLDPDDSIVVVSLTHIVPQPGVFAVDYSFQTTLHDVNRKMISTAELCGKSPGVSLP